MTSRTLIDPRTSVTPPALLVTAEDMARLRAVVELHLEGSRAAAAELLELELDRATVVPQARIPPDVVTMRSRICFEDIATGSRREATLVYPEEADIAQSKVSILAPAGLAILGLKVGDAIDWPMPHGRVASLRITEVLYQPEAAGDFHL